MSLGLVGCQSARAFDFECSFVAMPSREKKRNPWTDAQVCAELVLILFIHVAYVARHQEQIVVETTPFAMPGSKY